MLDRHNRVACAVRKAIEIGNPQARILDDKTVRSVCPDIEPELRLLRPDLMFESSIRKGRKLENIMYLVEIATPWSYEDSNHSALKVSYDKKVAKYKPVVADIERKRPGFKCIQATIIVSPTGAFYRDSQEEFAKVSKLPRGKLAIHKRCIVDAAIQGAYEQWRQFGNKLALSAQLEALNPGATDRLRFADPEEAEAMGEQIMAECPEISVDVSVLTREDGPNQVINPEVGEISPIELYEASLSEARTRQEDGLPIRAIERHPDGHKEDADDGMDHMFGRRAPLDTRTHIRKELTEAPRFLPILPAPDRVAPADQVVVDCGFRGNWTSLQVPRDIDEAGLNALVSRFIDHTVATTDFTGAPINDQQYRFYPDISRSTPIWITLKQGLKRSNLTMIMKISKENSQAEIEKAASIYWEQPMEFKSFPAVFDSTVTYWMRPHSEEPPDPNELPFPEPETLDAIPHVETPTYKPLTVSFPRSLSSDDLKGTPSVPLGGKSADSLTKWVVMFGPTCVTYWAPEDAPEEIVVAKAAQSIGLKDKGWRIRRGDKWNIYCSDSSNVPEASIHFGNIEWRGKVEPTYSNDQLIASAQSQLSIVGTWKVRSSHWEDHVHHIECEQTEEEPFRPPLPEEAEVHFNFEGSVRKATLPGGADQIAQAAKAQELFQETLLCGPIEYAGDHWQIALTRPRLFPITILYKGEPTKIWCDNTSPKSIQEEASRVFGRKFNLRRKMDQPGLVFEADVEKSKKAIPPDSTRTRSMGKTKVASPSVAHMRSAGPQPLDHRAPISRPIPGKGGIQVTVLLPALSSTIYNVEIPETATREEILTIVCQKVNMPVIHEEYVEIGPLEWFTRKMLTIKYDYPRPTLSALDIVSRETFLAQFDPSRPVFIETDGACSGNPGVGGWGAIICQKQVAVELHGPDPHTSNNEMELQAIDEALKLLPADFSGYVVIESDSEGCIDTMRTRGQRWKRDNYVNLRGCKVKNQKFVDSIITRLETLKVDYRKVKGHNNDTWNDRADALAVMGRNEAAAWPQCSFDVVMPNKATIPFATRSIPPKTTRVELFEAFSHETHARLPPSQEFECYDSKRELFHGDWVSGRYTYVHNSQPPPSVGAQPNPAQAPDPAVDRSISFGVFNGSGISFTPTKKMDCSKIEMFRMIQEFNRAVPGFGDNPRFFVGLEETDASALIPGQPYSVYPKKIKRPSENRASLSAAIKMARIEGPMVDIQWKVTDVNGKELCLPGHSRVPEEISLLQLFKIFIYPKFHIQGIQISWGNHYRGSAILEVGQVSSLEPGDLVEIVVDQGAAPVATQVEVQYQIESEKFTMFVDRATTIEQLKQRLSFTHKGKRITGISINGSQIADEDPVEEWIQRSSGVPFVVTLPKTVQVVVNFRGTEKHFAVQDDVPLKDFEALVKQFLNIGSRVHIAVEPLGLDAWEIRAGTTYWVAETRIMEIWITDTSHGRTHLRIAGNTEIDQVLALYREKHNIPDWDEVTIKRKDKAPFWVEERGEYTVEIRYDPRRDPRAVCTVKIVTLVENKVFLIENYRAPTLDPAMIWTDMCGKYGFIDPGANFLHVEGHPNDGLVTYTYRLPASLGRVQLSPFISRTFKIIEEQDEWNSGEILSPIAWGKEEIWAQITSLHALPHYSQFHFSYSLGEIPATSRTLPPGIINVVRLKFPVKWRLELFSEEIIQPDMHAGITAQAAWVQLHHQVPRLYQDATLNYTGPLQPGAVITAEVIRELVTVSVAFEVKDHGWIEYTNYPDTSNMLTRREIYDYFAAMDPRIPPLAEYTEEDTRPYQDHSWICFTLKGFIAITDRSDERPGRLGGDSSTGVMLPAIRYGKQPIDTRDPRYPKIQGGHRGTVVNPNDSDSEQVSDQTDSENDDPLQKIAAALSNDEPVMVVIVGHFEGYQEIRAQCEFRLSYKGPPPPSLKDFFNYHWRRIREAAPKHGSSGMPNALLWTVQAFQDSDLNIAVYKFGMGLKVRYQLKDMKGLEMAKWPTVFTVDLEDGISIAFPGVPRLPDAFLMKYLVNITAPWDGHEFGTPWQIYCGQQTWRKSETGEIFLQKMPGYPADWNAEAFNPRVPFNAAQSRDFSEIRDKQEISRILKFGRDNEWPLLLSCASSLDGMNSIAVTYETTLEECEDSIRWFLNKFKSLMVADGLVGLPVEARLGVVWERTCRVEDFRVHIFITEVGVNTPEEDGPPCMLFYAPKATFKLRCESIEVAKRAIVMCYGQEPAYGEEHHTKEWALIGSINGGKIDDKHLVQLEGDHDLEQVAEWNKETFIAGLATQPYGVGLGKFAAKFKPDAPYSATIAMETGTHAEHGVSIFFEQGARRCVLTRRVYGISGEDAFWYAMKDWAQFQPRRAKPRNGVGNLYYPVEYHHIVEKYWDYLDDPTKHPDQDMSPHSRSSMKAMAEALESMDLEDFIPKPDTEASDKSMRIARTAALSRRCPIMDGVDYWKPVQERLQEEAALLEAGKISGMHRSSADSDGSLSQGSAMVGTESSPGSGQTEIGADQGGPPSYT
jgi:ribonuclease HI